MVSLGIYSIYLCKVSQANLLREKWNTIDTMEKTATININPSCGNSKIFCSDDNMTSEKIKFDIKDSNNTRDYILDLLISLRGSHYSPPILLYISTILEKIIHLNHKLMNKIMGVTHKFVPEPLMVLFGGAPIVLFVGLAIFINSLYLPYLMLMSFNQLLLVNIGDAKHKIASWGNIGLFSIKDWIIGFITIAIVLMVVGPFALKLGPILSFFIALYSLIAPSFFVAKKEGNNEVYTTKHVFKDNYKYKNLLIKFFLILLNLIGFYHFFQNKYVKNIILLITVIVIYKMTKRSLISSPGGTMTKLSSYVESVKKTDPDRDIIPSSIFSIFSKFGEIFSRFSETIVMDPKVQEYNMSSNVKRYNKSKY
jgi:hypothetical protein